MKKANLIVSAIIAILGIIIIAISLSYPKADAYGTGAPGPGLWPICISIILLLMSLLLAVKSLFGIKEDDTSIDLLTVDHLRVYIAMAFLILYVAILKPVGFLIPSFLMLTFFIYWFSKETDESYKAPKPKNKFMGYAYLVFDIKDGLKQARPLWLCAVIALIASFGIYFVFKLGLNVPMNFGLYI